MDDLPGCTGSVTLKTMAMASASATKGAEPKRRTPETVSMISFGWGLAVGGGETDGSCIGCVVVDVGLGVEVGGWVAVGSGSRVG